VKLNFSFLQTRSYLLHTVRTEIKFSSQTFVWTSLVPNLIHIGPSTQYSYICTLCETRKRRLLCFLDRNHVDTSLLNFCLYSQFPLLSLFFFDWLYSPYGPSPLFSFLIYSQSAGFLGRMISSSQGLYRNTGQHRHRINTYTHQTWDSNPRSQRPSERRQPMPYTARLLSLLQFWNSLRWWPGPVILRTSFGLS
jgi:hypothetical protein